MARRSRNQPAHRPSPVHPPDHDAPPAPPPPEPHVAKALPPELGGVQRKKDSVDLSEYNDGKGYVQISTGEIFGLKMVPDDVYERPYHLKNAEHFCAVNEQKFREQFQKQ